MGCRKGTCRYEINDRPTNVFRTWFLPPHSLYLLCLVLVSAFCIPHRVRALCEVPFDPSKKNGPREPFARSPRSKPTPAQQPDRLPDDEIPDTSLAPDLIRRRAVERYPTESLILRPESQTLRSVFTQQAQRNFKATLQGIDPRIVAKIEQPFGKDNLFQCFLSQAALRHVLLPLWKSGALGDLDTLAWQNLAAAYYPAAIC